MKNCRYVVLVVLRVPVLAFTALATYQARGV